MSQVLTDTSDVECGHGGIVSVSSASKLAVDGAKVLLPKGVSGADVSSACGTPVSNSTHKCKKVSAVAPASQAKKLTVGGTPVVLDTLSGLTDGLPPGTLVAHAKQSKLTAL